VLFLLRLERKQSPDVSFALWIPTIWMLYIASKPLGVWFGNVGEMEEGSPFDRAFLMALLCIGLLILFLKGFSWSGIIKENKWVVLLVVYMLVSIAWSEMPYTSFKRWNREVIAVVMAFLIVTEREPRRAIQCLFRRSIYVLIPFSILLIKYFPHYGVAFGHWSGALMWTGVALQKNGLGRLCLIAILFLVWTLYRRWKGRDKIVVGYQTPVEVFLLILSFWLFTGPQHTLTYSATSTVALAVGLSAFVGLFWLKKQNRLIGTGVLIFIISFLIIFGTVTPFMGRLPIDFSAALGRAENLTGRADIWATLVPYALQKPILGHGLGGFWTDAIRSISSSHAHNGYLDIILNLGFVGLIMFSLFLLSSCRKTHGEMLRDFDWGVLWTCYLLVAVTHNIAESTITSFTNHIMNILLCFYVASSVSHTHERKNICQTKLR